MKASIPLTDLNSVLTSLVCPVSAGGVRGCAPPADPLAPHRPLAAGLGHHHGTRHPELRQLRPPHRTPQLYEQCPQLGPQEERKAHVMVVLMFSSLPWCSGSAGGAAVPGHVDLLQHQLRGGGLHHREGNPLHDLHKEDCKYSCVPWACCCSSRYNSFGRI